MKSIYEKSNGYSYGKAMTEDDTVAELTEGVFWEWNDKLEVMGSICDFYDFVWRFYPDGRLVLTDRLTYEDDPVNSCEWSGKSDESHLKYNDLDHMLLEWAHELTEEQAELFQEEIKFIEENIKSE